MDDLRKIWGERVADARAAAGLTQRALGDKVGVTTSYIAVLEQGKRGAGHATRLALAAALGVDVNELFAYPAEAAA